MKGHWLIISVLLALVGFSRVRAHTIEVVKSEPAAGAVLTEAPSEVRVWFSEELQTQGSTLQVLDAQGEQVDRGDGGVDLNDPNHASMVVSLPPVPEGAYSVRWLAILLDGDAGEGEFIFYVGAAGAAAATAEAALLPTGKAAPSSQASTPQAPSSMQWLVVGGAGLLLVAGTIFLLARKRRSPTP